MSEEHEGLDRKQIAAKLANAEMAVAELAAKVAATQADLRYAESSVQYWKARLNGGTERQASEHMERTLQRSLVKASQVQKILGVSAVTLWRWRMHGTGPIWCKLGTRVMYDAADVQRFVSESIKDASHE